ncbi:uncharacterized protein METZ01_LOCUS447918, partial [marine metagenome]
SNGSLSLSGSVGYSLSFDGVDDYIDCGSNFTFTSDFSIEVYVKHNPIGNYSTFAANLEYGINEGYWLGSNSSGIAQFWIGNVTPASGTTLINDGEWHHVAGVYSSGTSYLYVDGVLESTLVPTLALSSTINLTLGRDVSGYWLDGELDEVRLWSLARSEQQILENMHLTLDGSETGLLGYYQMNEGSGTTVADNSGNGNDGTIYGATWDTENGANSAAVSGTFTYNPTANYNGSDSFVFSASDGTLSDTATVSITIT